MRSGLPSLIRHHLQEKAAVPQGQRLFCSWNAGNAPEQVRWAPKARMRFIFRYGAIFQDRVLYATVTFRGEHTVKHP